MLNGAAPKVGGGEREKREKGILYIIIAVSDTLLVVSTCVCEECVCNLHDVCMNGVYQSSSMWFTKLCIFFAHTK